MLDDVLWTVTEYVFPEVIWSTPLWMTKLNPEGEIEMMEGAFPFAPNTVALTSSDWLTTCEPVEMTSELAPSPRRVISKGRAIVPLFRTPIVK